MLNYTPPVVGEIPMIAKYPVPANSLTPHGFIDGISECGFNTVLAIGTLATLENLMTQRRMSSEDKPLESDGDFTRRSLYGKGLKAILHNSGLMNANQYAAVVEKFSKNPLTAGWFLRDAPRLNELSATKAMMDSVYDASGKELVVVQLAESMLAGFTDGYSSYSDYLKDMKVKLAPAVWLTNMNPFLIVDGKVTCNLSLIYGNLEAVRSVATSENPMWTYFHTGSLLSTSSERPAPTEEMLRMEIFTALAYGSKGLVGSMYCLQPSRPGVDYITALVKENGDQFPAWNSTCKILHEVRKYTDVFLNTKVEDVRHTGKQYSGTIPLGSDAIGCLTSIAGPDAGVLVSYLKGIYSSDDRSEKYDYIVIVNHSYKEYQELQLTFRANLYAPIEELTPVRLSNSSTSVKSVTASRIPVMVFTITRTLSPGGYLIFRYKQL